MCNCGRGVSVNKNVSVSHKRSKWDSLMFSAAASNFPVDCRRNWLSSLKMIVFIICCLHLKFDHQVFLPPSPLPYPLSGPDRINLKLKRRLEAVAMVTCHYFSAFLTCLIKRPLYWKFWSKIDRYAALFAFYLLLLLSSLSLSRPPNVSCVFFFVCLLCREKIQKIEDIKKNIRDAILVNSHSYSFAWFNDSALCRYISLAIVVWNTWCEEKLNRK